MALQVVSRSISSPIGSLPSPSSRRTKQSQIAVIGDNRGASSRIIGTMTMKRKKGVSYFTVRSSLVTAGPVAMVGRVTEVNKDNFWPIVNSAGDKTVVVDMYTQWCGPCKVIAPKFQMLSEKYLDVLFLKLDCNQDNKLLAKELGIRVVPTFKIIKGSKIVKEVTGAKYDELVVAIESVRII